MNPLNYFNDKTILITGSNGFLGRNLVEMFRGSSAKIIGLGRNGDSLNKDIIYYQCDLRDYNRLKEIIEREEPRIIYNLASLNNTSRDYSLYPDMLDIHVKALYSFYSILRDNPVFKLLVNMGSSEEYGSYERVPFQEDLFERSISPYAASKTAGTHFAYLIGKNEQFPVITIRPGIIFGPHQSEERFIPYVIKELTAGRRLELTPCEQRRDFIPVRAFLQILQRLTASEAYQPGEIYNIGSGISLRLKEVVLFLRDAAKSGSEISFGALPYRKNEIMESQLALGKIKSLVDYSLCAADIREEMIKLL